MLGARFIMLSLVHTDDLGGRVQDVSWLLVSSNNRPLGKGPSTFESSEACREEVQRLRRAYDRISTSATPAESTGQWAWRVALDGATVAVSTRTYLRQRECDYNLRKFLEAVPEADVAPATRIIRPLQRR